MQKQAGPLQGFCDVEPDAGGGHPGGRQRHRAGDIPAAPAGVTLHPLLRLQALPGRQEEEEEEEEGPGPAGRCTLKHSLFSY